MLRVKEFIEKEIEQANFKLNYIIDLMAKYNLNDDGFNTETKNIEIEVETYTKVLTFIDGLKREDREIKQPTTTPTYESRDESKTEEKVVYKDTNEIGWKCFVARKKLGETMQEFSKRFNVDTSAIGKWERGVAHPNRKNYKKIDEIFEMVKTYGQTK